MKSTFEECVLTLRHLPRMEDEEASLLDIADSIEVPPYVQSFVDRLVRCVVIQTRIDCVLGVAFISWRLLICEGLLCIDFDQSVGRFLMV